MNPLALLLMANGTKIPIKYVKEGEVVVSMNPSTQKIRTSTVKKLFCHRDKKYTLWSVKKSSFTNLFTENHPLLMNGSWMAININESFNDFGVRASKLSNVLKSDEYVNEVCAIELSDKITLAYNVEGFWFAD